MHHYLNLQLSTPVTPGQDLGEPHNWIPAAPSHWQCETLNHCFYPKPLFHSSSFSKSSTDSGAGPSLASFCPQACAQATTQPNLLQVPQHLRGAFASDAVQGEPGPRGALQGFVTKVPKFCGSFRGWDRGSSQSTCINLNIYLRAAESSRAKIYQNQGTAGVGRDSFQSLPCAGRHLQLDQVAPSPI